MDNLLFYGDPFFGSFEGVRFEVSDNRHRGGAGIANNRM